jgi:4-phosphopantoate--beta-alanine ligase
MTQIPKEHPRYESLMIREKLVYGLKMGITAQQGLIAQGRGESFDYLIGEHTTECAAYAERAAVALLLLAERPVISINGNTAALVPETVIALADVTGAKIEVNLFHRSEARIHRIIEHLKAYGAAEVLGKKADALLPLEHDRGKVDKEGIYSADVVVVPLEDGDRCEALVKMGKVVIAIDLNPMSRTALASHVTIVDNVTRALPNMLQFAKDMKQNSTEDLRNVVDCYDNNKILSSAIYEIHERLMNMAVERGIEWI